MQFAGGLPLHGFYKHSGLLCSQGWDKTYCLRFLDDKYETIHFFGDKTFQVRADSFLKFMHWESAA